MPDTSHIEGLDPYDAQDAEAARLEAHLARLDDDGWSAPSRCSGWSVRDVVGHLAAVEHYHGACLDGRVAAMIEEGLASGLTSLDEFNQAGVDERADRPAADVVAEFVTADAETRRRFRERDGGELDSSVGPYPARWQAFHVADELAVHADDIGVPVNDAEAAERLAWRAPFSRFSLSERRPDATVEATAGGTRVVDDGVDVVVDDATLVDGVAGRLDDDTAPEVGVALSAPA
jgi:uncharacterized protein (TIGR03083 family)